jgi:DNA-binding transcriptional regulator LsrR (DeoR family)
MKPPKRRVIDDPQRLARVARNYYIGEMTQAGIARAEGVNQSSVAHWLAAARDLGIVSIDIDPDFGLSGSENHEMSRHLRDAFGLRECFVVDGGSEALYESKRSEDLHTVIANTVGVRLREWIQSGDHVVVAGGRAPTKVARFIRRAPRPRREIRISPLSGRIWTGSWQPDGPQNLQRPLDADDAARLLALAYEHEPGTRFSQIGHPLYVASADAAQQIIKEECVFGPRGSWKTEQGFAEPSRALVGVGVLDDSSGHRINELLTKVANDRNQLVARHLHRTADQFVKAIEYAESHDLPPIGDVANRLFPAVPLPQTLIAAAKRPAPAAYVGLTKRLQELNDRAVVMEWAHLRRIPSVWAVAGGEAKAHVLWTLLICKVVEADRNSALVKELAVDLQCAEILDRALEDFRNAPQEIRDWYAAICPTIFE